MQKTNKQDAQGVRTAADLERKYRFGKSLTEVRVVTNSAQSAAADASRAVARLDQKLDAEELAARLTNARLASANDAMALDFAAGTANFGNGLRLNDTAFFAPGADGKTELRADRINPGKTALFAGRLNVGDVAEMPGLGDFDLLAVTLGTEDGAISHTLLAYKAGNMLQGFGGAGGSLFWFTATEAGGLWLISQAEMTTGETVTPLGLAGIVGIV